MKAIRRSGLVRLWSRSLLALAVLTVVILWGLSASGKSQAAVTGTPVMEFEVAGANSCNAADSPTKCTEHLGDSFTLSVDLETRDPDGTLTWQTYIKYGALTYNMSANPATEFKDSGPFAHSDRSVGFTADSISHSKGHDISPPFNNLSTYKGNLINLSMNCPATPTVVVVTLEPLGGPVAGGAGTGYTGSNGAGGVDPDVALSDSITINCTLPVGGLADVPEVPGPSGGDSVLPYAAGAAAAALLGMGAYSVLRRLARPR